MLGYIPEGIPYLVLSTPLQHVLVVAYAGGDVSAVWRRKAADPGGTVVESVSLSNFDIKRTCGKILESTPPPLDSDFRAGIRFDKLV